MERDRDTSRSSVVMAWFLALTYGLSWSIAMPAALATRGLLHLHVARGLQTAAQFAPAAAALVVVGWFYGFAAVRLMVRSLLRVRLRARWYAVALLLAPLTQAAAVMVYRAVWHATPKFDRWTQAPLLFVVLAIFSVGEELGWRGLLLPLLLKRHSALTATAWMALSWGLWHLPFYMATNSEGSRTGWLYLLFLAGIFPVCAVFTLLYVRTRSLFLCLLFHGSLNAGAAYWFAPLPTGELRPFAIWILLLWLACVPVVRGLARISSAVTSQPTPEALRLDPFVQDA